MLNPQMTSSQMELLPLVCLCLLSWSGTTSADQPETVVVGEGGDVVLKCSINVNMETGAFEWTKGQKEVFTFDAGQYSQAEQFKGRVSHFQDELKNGNTAIKITNATMDDSGDYTCEFPNNHPSPTFNVKLVVVTGAAPEPSVTTLDETKTSALLQCEAHGVPEPEVHWQDSAGNILTAEKPQVTERGGRKYITLKTTVTKTDKFSCVATQKKLSHTISSQIYVLLNEPDYTGWIILLVFIALVVFAVAGGVVFYRRKQKHKRELQEKKDKIIKEVQEKIKMSASAACEEMKNIDEGHQKIKTIISEVQENKKTASAACEEIKTINEEANEKMKKIDEGLQKIIKRPSEANEKIKKIDEGSSDHPNESVPLNPLNSSV